MRVAQRMTRMTEPDCAVMCNLINTHTHTHTHTHTCFDHTYIQMMQRRRRSSSILTHPMSTCDREGIPCVLVRTQHGVFLVNCLSTGSFYPTVI